MPPPTNLQQVPQWFPDRLSAVNSANPLYQNTYGPRANQFNNFGPGTQNPNVTNPSQGYVNFNGSVVPASQFAQSNPDQWNALFATSGGANPQSAGSPGSPFPAALPVNSFEAAIQSATDAMNAANADNEKRNNQGLANTANQGKLVDSAFAGLGTRVDENNAASAADQAAIQAGAQGAGDFAISEAKRAGAANEGAATSSALSRGLFGSTVLDSLQNRQKDITNRNVADLTDKQIQYQTSLKQNAAQVAQQGRLDRTNVDQNAFTAKYNQLGDRRNFIASKVVNGPNPADLAALISNHEVGQASARAAQNASGNALFGGALGALGSLGGAAITAFSDKRLKTDVKDTGEKKEINGKDVPVYTFKYTNAAKKAGRGKPGKFKGPMAQDVERAEPGMVEKDSDGFRKIRSKWAGPKKVAKK